MTSELSLLGILVVPAMIAMWRSRGVDVSAFAFNAGRNSLVQTSASVICGNIGIGTFVVYYLFTRASPLVGVAAALAGIFGLLLCALLARYVHGVSQRTGTRGLVDLIVATHGVQRPILIWIPVALVFMMRILVQLSALALVLAEGLGLSFIAALALGTAISGIYVAVGGYRAATETDLFHALVIVLLMALAVFAMPAVEMDSHAWFDLGPYSPIILVGIFLFLPFGAILGIDNWQRISTAQSASTAMRAYLIAAVVCGFVYLAVVWVALLPDGPDDVLAAFRGLMPASAPWLADILLVSAIVSSIDTFAVPLISTFARQGLPLHRLRLLIVAIFAVVAVAAAFLGDILASVVAAFNSLAVFLPAVFGAVLLKNPRAEAAIASMSLGLVAALLLSVVDQNSAGPAAFMISIIIYWVIQRRTRPIAPLEEWKRNISRPDHS